MKVKRKVTGIYGVLHFFVDFCCAFFLFRVFYESGNLYQYFFIYNFCAFALQMPAGLLADKLNRNCPVAAAGGLLVAVPALLFNIFSAVDFNYDVMITWLEAAAIIFVGIGNCLFHVGGGIEILNKGKEKLTPLGIFISPGAIGIFLGGILGKERGLPYLLPYLFLLAGIAFLLFWQKKTYGGFVSENEYVCDNYTDEYKSVLITALFCFFLVVVLRSHLGMVFSFPWKKEMTGGILCLAGVVLGKAAGGILADRLGIGKTAFFSLLFAAICFCFSRYAGFGVAGIFFFNMSMPLTLYLAADLLNKSKGFAFGILTFAIFIGFLPCYFGFNICTPGLLMGISLCSLLFFMAGYKLIRGRYDGNDL